MKNEKHFTRDDIKHVYTATIQLAIEAGWSIHPWTMNGSQGEICKVHMEKDGGAPRHLPGHLQRLRQGLLALP